MSPQPLVSVVMSTYRRTDLLLQAARSVLSQSLTDLELIIVDDHSPEDPSDAVAGLDDDRVRLVRQPANVGIARNVTTGMALARGRYTTNVHDDDLLDREYLQTLVDALAGAPDAVLAFCDHRIIGPDGAVDPAATEERSTREGRASLSPGPHPRFWDLALAHDTVFLGLGCLWRTGTIAWDEVAEAGDHWDQYTLYCLCRDGGQAVYVPQRLGSWRSHSGSNTMMAAGPLDPAVKLRTGRSQVFCYQRYSSDPRLAGIRPRLRNRLAEAHASVGIAQLRAGDAAAARRALLRSIRTRPTLRGAVAALATGLPRGVRARVAAVRRPVGAESTTGDGR